MVGPVAGPPAKPLELAANSAAELGAQRTHALLCTDVGVVAHVVKHRTAVCMPSSIAVV
jgi:hypothetical protein